VIAEGTELPHYLFVFDDMLNDIALITPVLNMMSSIGRHFQLSYFLTTQSHKRLHPIIRRNSTNIAIMSLNL